MARPRHRSRSRTPPASTTPILSLLDAIAMVDEIVGWATPPSPARRTGPTASLHGVLVLDDDHEIIDLHTGQERGRYPFTLDDIATWAQRRAELDPRGTKLVFLSAGLADIRTLDERTISRYQQLCRGAARAGVEVLDWILADAERFRSMAYAVHPHQAWSTQPIDQRAEMLRLLVDDNPINNRPTDAGPTEAGPIDGSPGDAGPTDARPTDDRPSPDEPG